MGINKQRARGYSIAALGIKNFNVTTKSIGNLSGRQTL